VKSILLVDDDRNLSETLAELVDPKEYRVDILGDGPGTLEYIRANGPDVILLDVNLPSGSGLELLKEIKEIEGAPPVIIISGYVSTDNAMEAMKEGAYEYVTKPFQMDRLLLTINKATEELHASAMAHRQARPEMPWQAPIDITHETADTHREIVGVSDEIVEIAKMIGRVAKSDAAVLIFGESGTGKELVARAIHRNSNRSEKVFLSVNCAALTETLLESELFGHEKGAFTNAYSRKLGKFELANGGTIFLDEIADTSLTTQSKLLRMLQEQEFERVGGEQTIKVNVRVIAATNKSLVTAIKEGKFRIDLFYRLKVVSIYLPPLRERRDDIPLLANHFLDIYNKATGKKVEGITSEAMKVLGKYSWPGNVRELENTIQTAVVMSKNRVLEADDLPISRDRRELVKIDFDEIKDNYYQMFRRLLEPIYGKIYQNSNGQIYAHIQEAFEKAVIGLTLQQLNNNQVRAAESLGISRNTLRDRIDKYGIK
jgi:two-component system, NtrC family, nitrogen regulation response regulator GlnG